MNKLSKALLCNVLMFLLIAGLAACDTGAPTEKKTDKPAETKTSPDAEKKPDAGSPEGEKKSDADKTASTGDKIGVAECDEYLEKVEACIMGKVPEAARTPFKSSMEQTRKSWKDLAANPQTKGTLATACKTALDNAKKSFSAYQCEF
ncbi:MAG: hypothetical protein R2747_21945 [Pyrinomonadaceae bacterium]